MKAVVIYFILSILSHDCRRSKYFYQNASWSPDGKKFAPEVIKKNQNDISLEAISSMYQKKILNKVEE